MNHASYLLERYFEGKDKDRPEVIKETFSNSAIVTFDIKTDVISFPPIIEGSDNIAAQMFDDFHQKFEHVESYYVITGDRPEPKENQILSLPWLVTMKEREGNIFRVGTGYYDWTFEKNKSTDGDQSQWLVNALHIYIHDMVVFEVEDPKYLSLLRKNYSYPWLNRDALIASLAEDQRFSTILSFHENHEKSKMCVQDALVTV
ncbi:MAG: hypothetical protein COA42_12445 [Alteromonadaceae bacterium]|nr:MAG: hypothetical protein COA42_12445 [Alteromonadaceae bacterium]